jgi:hypothetical protein
VGLELLAKCNLHSFTQWLKGFDLTFSNPCACLQTSHKFSGRILALGYNKVVALRDYLVLDHAKDNFFTWRDTRFPADIGGGRPGNERNVAPEQLRRTKVYGAAIKRAMKRRCCLSKEIEPHYATSKTGRYFFVRP